MSLFLEGMSSDELLRVLRTMLKVEVSEVTPVFFILGLLEVKDHFFSFSELSAQIKRSSQCNFPTYYT